jgi:phosphoglycolate phosphatase
MDKIKEFFFDFDGTLSSSEEVFWQIFQKASVKFGFPIPENIDGLKYVRGLTNQEIVKNLISQSLRSFRGFELYVFFKKEMLNYRDDISCYKGIPELLHSCLHKNLRVLSSNNKKLIQYVLKKENCPDIPIYTVSSLYTKDNFFRKYQKKNPLSSPIYIGDETRDIEAAEKVSIPSIAVTWGAHSEELLSTYNPTHIISSVSELQNLILTS